MAETGKAKASVSGGSGIVKSKTRAKAKAYTRKPTAEKPIESGILADQEGNVRRKPSFGAPLTVSSEKSAKALRTLEPGAKRGDRVAKLPSRW